MSTIKDLEKQLAEKPALLGELLANPKNALKKANLNFENEAEVRKLEAFVHDAHEHIKLSSKSMGFIARLDDAAWGVGIGCCNSASLKNIPGRTPPGR